MIATSSPSQNFGKPNSNKNPNDPVTKDDLEEFKQEMFQRIDQWKNEIISAASQGRRY